MRYAVSIILLILSTSALAAPRPTAVYPSPATPGQSITVLAQEVGPDARVLLGEIVLTPTYNPPGTLTFTLPPMAVGEYLLQIQQGDLLSTQPLTLRIAEPTPRIISLDPANIDQCADASDRLVQLETQDVLPGASLLLNGAALPFSMPAQGVLSTQVPPLSAGTYGMEIINPGGTRSLPQTIWFNNLPRIEAIDQGEDYVNYYQLTLRGRNFFPASTLMVQEFPTGFNPLPPMQKVVPPQGASTGGSGQVIQRQSDHLQFVDCTTLIYNRFPYSNQPRQVIIQVVNPDGRRSATQTLTIP